MESTTTMEPTAAVETSTTAMETSATAMETLAPSMETLAPSMGVGRMWLAERGNAQQSHGSGRQGPSYPRPGPMPA